MNESKIIESLKSSANDDTARAIYGLFLERERARGTVRVVNLKRSFKAIKIEYREDKVTSCLKLLAQLGLGTLEVSPRGKVKGIKNIPVTLQSIGEAALNGTMFLTRFKSRVTGAGIIRKAPVKEKPKAAVQNIELTMPLNTHGKVTMRFDQMNSAQIARLIEVVKTIN